MEYSEYMIEMIKKEFQARVAIVVFLFYSVWWLILNLSSKSDGMYHELFSDTYGITAVIGFFIGFFVSKHWGGWKTKMGRSIMLFAFGLIAQAFGQFVYTMYYIIKGIEAAYPSIGDIGYFGSIPLYIYAVILLAEAAGVRFSFRKVRNVAIAIVVPVILLIASYVVFLRGYEFDFSEPIRVFLDFGYPLGQAIYISLALVTYLLSRELLGGVMKKKILFILIALIIQYVADYTFLYQQIHETWQAGGINDYMYLVSYFVMTMALFNVRVSDVRDKLSRM